MRVVRDGLSTMQWTGNCDRADNDDNLRIKDAVEGMRSPIKIDEVIHNQCYPVPCFLRKCFSS